MPIFIVRSKLTISRQLNLPSSFWPYMVTDHELWLLTSFSQSCITTKNTPKSIKLHFWKYLATLTFEHNKFVATRDKCVNDVWLKSLQWFRSYSVHKIIGSSLADFDLWTNGLLAGVMSFVIANDYLWPISVNYVQKTDAQTHAQTDEQKDWTTWKHMPPLLSVMDA